MHLVSRRPLPLGATITGVSHEALADERIRQEIRSAFEQHVLLVFEDVEPSSRIHLAITCAGPSRRNIPARSR